MKNDKTVSKLADAQTELTVLSSQPEHIQVQLQISAKARGWDICRGFCTFRTEIVSPVSLYLSRGSQRRPGERGSCYILERWSGKFEQRCESEQEKSVNRAGEYGTGNLCRDCRFSLVLYNYVIHKNHTV